MALMQMISFTLLSPTGVTLPSPVAIEHPGRNAHTSWMILFREHICNTVTFCITKGNLLGLVLLLRGHVKLLLLFKPKKNIWPQVDVIFYKFRVMGRHQNQQNLRDMAPLNALFKTCIYQKHIVLYSMTSIINYYYYTILLFLCTTAYSQNR